MRNVLSRTSACRRAVSYRARRSAPSGVSLLEVMFSIGVAMIGLVGVAALLPLAGVQTNKGERANTAARLGADAVRDFQVRSMGNPATWRWYDPSGNQFRPPTWTELADGLSFCLDPRFVAQGAVAPADHSHRNGFPYIDDLYGPSVILSMPRITLSPSPASAATDFMDRLQADQLFRSGDSLSFDLPADRTLGPRQVFSRAPNPSALPPEQRTPLRRSTSGAYSWMATLVPRLDRVGNLTDEYTLSVVVFWRRVIDPTLTNENVASERVVHVATLPSGVPAFYSGQPAIGGGDVRLAARRNAPGDLLLRAGDWVMLSGQKQRTGTLRDILVHKWYRVVNAGEEEPLEIPAGSGNWFRDVTLVGPDWDWQGLAPGTRTQVTIVRGVVTVLEKTIRLETSSLWTN